MRSASKVTKREKLINYLKVPFDHVVHAARELRRCRQLALPLDRKQGDGRRLGRRRGGRSRHGTRRSAAGGSRRNDAPELVPRPYDVGRDGLVIGEGGGVLLLESLDSALERNATIHAEIAGFATNAAGTHVTRPREETMQRVLQLALEDAGIDAGRVGSRARRGRPF